MIKSTDLEHRVRIIEGKLQAIQFYMEYLRNEDEQLYKIDDNLVVLLRHLSTLDES